MVICLSNLSRKLNFLACLFFLLRFFPAGQGDGYNGRAGEAQVRSQIPQPFHEGDSSWSHCHCLHDARQSGRGGVPHRDIRLRAILPRA